jgi:hypothetical protein
MVKPPASSIPGMTDTLDFVKNLWGSMHIPGANMPGMSALAGPPLSVEDLDKRIADLKAVESWLNLNVTMLRGSIQAMEVQRGTLVTLRTMGSSMAEAMRQSGVSAEKMANTPFASFFGQPASAPAAKPAEPPPPPPPAPDASVDPASAAAALGMPAAMAWWNMLQDQFTQAVTTAIAPAANADDGAGKQADVKPDPAAGDAAQGADNAGGTNGRARNGKPKADKA